MRAMKAVHHLITVAALVLGSSAYAAPTSRALDQVLNAKGAAPVDDGLSETRRNTLKEMADALGRRAGLIDRAAEICDDIKARAAELDSRFVFSSLITQEGVLPPVISEAVDIVSVMDRSMRVAGRKYKIEAEARFVGVAPTWRDYLYIGLKGLDDDKLVGDSNRTGLPRNDKEKAFYNKLILEGYAKGQDQADKIFHLNLARLESDFYGMRRFYGLVDRGLVTLPVIASATDAVSKKDPNTMTMGETVFRIVQPAAFQTDAKWKARQ